MRRFVFVMLIGLVSVRAFAADFAPPKDGVYSEKQLTEAIAVSKELVDSATAAGKAVEGSQSAALIIATMAKTNEKYQASLAKHGLSEAEFDWIKEQMWTAYGVLMQVDLFAGEQAQKDFDAQLKKQTAALDAAKKKLADVQAAQKSGKKILTDDERKTIVENARSDEQSAGDEAKSHADEVKQAQDDAAKADKDAKDAEKLAKNPPPDVGADDREQYVKDRQSDAENAKQAAKEARDRVAEAQKAQKESEAKVASAKARRQNPDVPQTDDEKAETTKQNEEAIASTNAEIDSLNTTIQTLNEAHDQAKKMAADAAKNAPAANVDLLRKHHTEFEAIFGMKK